MTSCNKGDGANTVYLALQHHHCLLVVDVLDQISRPAFAGRVLAGSLSHAAWNASATT